MSVAGKYEIVTKTPLGDQASTLTVVVDGGTFTGSNIGQTGSLDIENGRVDGNTLTWTSQLTVPMSIKLDITATVDGDLVTGTVTAGLFGSFPLTGRRVA